MITIDTTSLWVVAGLLFSGLCLIIYGISQALHDDMPEPPGQTGEGS